MLFLVYIRRNIPFHCVCSFKPTLLNVTSWNNPRGWKLSYSTLSQAKLSQHLQCSSKYVKTTSNALPIWSGSEKIRFVTKKQLRGSHLAVRSGFWFIWDSSWRLRQVAQFTENTYKYNYIIELKQHQAREGLKSLSNVLKFRSRQRMMPFASRHASTFARHAISFIRIIWIKSSFYRVNTFIFILFSCGILRSSCRWSPRVSFSRTWRTAIGQFERRLAVFHLMHPVHSLSHLE